MADWRLLVVVYSLNASSIAEDFLVFGVGTLRWNPVVRAKVLVTGRSPIG